MLLEYDPATSLRHWPASMKRFGTTPYGDALYRVVFAPSRRYLVCGTWPDGSTKAHWVPLYKQVGEQWVMEKWRPASELCPEGKAYWDLHNSALGPWPDRGDYDWVWTFDTASPNDTNIEALITYFALGQKSTLYEKVVFAREQEAKEREATREIARSMVQNRLPAFGCRPMFSSQVARGSKTVELKYSASDLGLPTQNGVIHTSRKPHQAA